MVDDVQEHLLCYWTKTRVGDSFLSNLTMTPGGFQSKKKKKRLNLAWKNENSTHTHSTASVLFESFVLYQVE